MEACDKLHEAGYRAQLSGDFAQAKSLYRQALEHKADHALAQLALAQLRMFETAFAQGRDEYEIRFTARREPGLDLRQLPLPRWRGEPVTGKHLYLWAEQGFGDVIQYAGFLPPLLAQQPSRITIGMFPKMMPLFARSFPQLSIESIEDAIRHSMSPALLDAFPQLLALAQQSGVEVDLGAMRSDYERVKRHGACDLAAPMGDLMVYGLPGFVPAEKMPHTMVADQGRVKEWQEKLQKLGPGRKVGISWHTANKESGIARNAPLEQWLPVLATPGCHFIALHHHADPVPLADFCARYGCTIVSEPQFDPIADTEGLAALVASMDEIIAIDNSNAHLGGGLGIPTTLLLPKGCDFRWPVLSGRHDTLWYESVTLQRQERAMEWAPVMARVAADLRKRVNA